MTPQGLQPQSPVDLRQQLVSSVLVTNPDYTDNLPGSMIEDICSTDIAACVQSDSFLVDLVNSITPNGANPYLLNQFGILYGLQPQSATNTSVYVTFFGPPGFIIVENFVVSDGTNQYVVQDGGIIGVDGQSLPLYAISPMPGTWPVPEGSVTQLATSVPANVAETLTVTNISGGFPSTAGEQITEYRARVMTAGLAASTGMSRYMKTLLGNVPGVSTRLVGARQDLATGRYIILVGGGDPYQVAYAVWKAVFWSAGLLYASINISHISSTNPVVITTSNNHNLMTGMSEQISGVLANGALASINGKILPVTVIDNKNFSVPYDGTPPGSSYISGGTAYPNPIMEEVTIQDYPDNYLIAYVIPAQEVVTLTITWQTDSPNYVSANAIATASAPALMDYILNLPVGTTPINIYDMTSIFLEAIAGILPAEAVTVLNFSVGIGSTYGSPASNGTPEVPSDVVGVAPAPGTGVIYGDPNSYFYIELARITVIERVVL
jgi:hypothetical protein